MEIVGDTPARGRTTGTTVTFWPDPTVFIAEGVEFVARGVDVGRGEVDLEPRHAGERPGRGADLGGEVRQRRQVVAERRGL